MSCAAKKAVLPDFIVTEASDHPVDGATPVFLSPKGQCPLSYYAVPKVLPNGERRDNKPKWVLGRYRMFPVVLCGDGAPWYEANLWLLNKLEGQPRPNMGTYAYLAEDLAAFRQFIEDDGIDWLDFPAYKLRRPTYRLNAALRMAVQSSAMSQSVAKRRMATVIRFYRWLKKDALFTPAHEMWSESDRYIEWKDQYGSSRVLPVTTTDISIKTSTADDPWDDSLRDGGRLRPLPGGEQKVLLEVLADLGNTEMTLIHLFSLLSGARSQTVLTVRVRHVIESPEEIAGRDVGLKAGPGTGIDTKQGKRGVLHLPRWFYGQLHVYAVSDRARTRRLKADDGDHLDQFLFLSRNGSSFYEPQAQRHVANVDGVSRRYAKAGQGVRQFILEKLLPEMRERMGNPGYSFSFHDLRATFGMNEVDAMACLMAAGKLTYTQAMDRLRQLMWHTSMTTTEHYLQYRNNRARVDVADEGWHRHLATLALRGLSTGRASAKR